VIISHLKSIGGAREVNEYWSLLEIALIDHSLGCSQKCEYLSPDLSTLIRALSLRVL
jgi:hypothetical protein